MKLTKNNKNDQLYKKFRKNQRQSEVAGQFNAMLWFTFILLCSSYDFCV